MVIECEYVVRGEIIILVQKLQEEIKDKLVAHPFKEIWYRNIKKPPTSQLVADNLFPRGIVASAYNCNGVKGLHDIIIVGIEAHDDIFADPNDIFLTDGASPTMHMVM
ncbi:hypothetical protein V6N13_123966 [Hibiscus sabdariffa]|uniref:Uncharacterized protein n=1 Tax=Hibiscus sabdariffa TaxID=183260 RepID=A0ABR2CPK2_9ROSI